LGAHLRTEAEHLRQIGESKLADNLTDIQKDIDLHLDAIRVDWLRLATADFDRLERKRIRDQITQQEADLMILLERKWAMERDQM
jgi:hypothetical protein